MTDSLIRSTSQLRRRTPGSFVLVPFPALGRSLRCQGQLEAAAATILTQCPLVSSIQEQPLSIRYAWREGASGPEIRLLADRGRDPQTAGIQVSYIVPDFLVRMTSGTVRLVEIKPSSRLERPKVRRALAVARAFARQRGWEFQTLSERQLLSGPLLANVRLLRRCRRLVVEPVLAHQLETFVLARGAEGVSLSEYATSAQQTIDQPLRWTLLHLLALGRLDCNPAEAPIDHLTPLFPGGTRPWDPFVLAWGRNGCVTDDRSASSVSSPLDNSSSGICDSKSI